MTKNTKLDEKLEGVNNFKAWKYQIMLILKENDLEGFIKEEVAEPKEDEAKAKYKKDMIKAKRIIDDCWVKLSLVNLPSINCQLGCVNFELLHCMCGQGSLNAHTSRNLKKF